MPPRLKSFALAAARLAAGLASLLIAAGCAAPPAGPLPPVQLRVLAINDFHGHLRPPADGLRLPDANAPGRSVTVPAGGAETLAGAVAELARGHRHHILVAAGDLVGASPLLSALFRDEPTIESLGLMGLALSAVGNHEFDHGAAELLRLQRGGCAAEGGCRGPQPFRGAAFQYLAASTVDATTGRTLLPAYAVRHYDGIPVAFVGLTLKDTPNIVVPSGVAGLRFRDEAETVNTLVPRLRAQGIEAIVLLIHEGGYPAGGPNECPAISGPIVRIVEKLDPAVDLVISGHTHRAYVCRIAGRTVTSAESFGRMLSAIDLTLDRATRDIVAVRAENHVVAPTFAKDPRQTALIEAYERLAAPLAQRVVARIAGPLARDAAPSGESPLGRLIADAQLAATREAGAQVALMNPGGIRQPLAPAADGSVRYEQLFAVQPFRNALVTMTLSGAQLVQLLEQQWLGQPFARVLQVSRGFGYAWDATQPPGRRVVPGSLRLHGRPVAPEESLRVTVNSYLAEGGDRFAVLAEGRDRRSGAMDLDALEAWLQALQADPALADDRAPRILRRD